jgi:hypothetical protein
LSPIEFCVIFETLRRGGGRGTVSRKSRKKSESPGRLSEYMLLFFCLENASAIDAIDLAVRCDEEDATILEDAANLPICRHEIGVDLQDVQCGGVEK